MTSFYKTFGDNVHNTLLKKNGVNFAHKGPWIQIFSETEIDRWHVGDFSSAVYTITAEFTSNKKETFQVSVVARPGQANYVVFGRVSIDDPLVNVTAEINNSYVSLKASATDDIYKGLKLLYSVDYTATIEQLSTPADVSFIISSPVSGSTGSSSGSGSGSTNSNVDFSNIGQNVLPSTDVIYDLGSPTKRWRDLYLSGNSLYLGDTAITRTSIGAVDLPSGSTVGGTDVFGFGTVRVSGNASQINAGALNDVLTFKAGSNISIVPNPVTNTITINSTGGGSGGSSGPAFASISVSGQTPVSAISSGDNLNLVAGSGISLVTNAGTNSITITNTGGSGGGSSNATAIKVQEVNSGILPLVVTSGTSSVTAQSLYANSTITINTGTGLLNATATSAQWADLAECYLADADYEPGTVLIFGGKNEVTSSTIVGDRRIAGVVSTDPAYLMNSMLEGDHVAAIALQGRVPCKVVGYIKKGDLMVSSHIPGVARSDNEAKMGTVIGKALEDYQSTEVGVIEVVVGRL